MFLSLFLCFSRSATTFAKIPRVPSSEKKERCHSEPRFLRAKNLPTRFTAKIRRACFFRFFFAFRALPQLLPKFPASPLPKKKSGVILSRVFCERRISQPDSRQKSAAHVSFAFSLLFALFHSYCQNSPRPLFRKKRAVSF